MPSKIKRISPFHLFYSKGELFCFNITNCKIQAYIAKAWQCNFLF